MYIPRSLWVMLFLCLCAVVGCPPSNVVRLDVGEGGGTLSVGGGSLDVPPGALKFEVQIRMEQDPSNGTVAPDENESPISEVFRITQDAGGLLDAVAAPLHLILPFDTGALGGASADDVTVFARMATEEDAFPLLGTVSGGKIELELFSLPVSFDIQVVYNPNAVLLLEDDEEPAKVLPAPTPWETTTWGVHFDSTSSMLRAAVATVLAKPAADVTWPDIAQVVHTRIRRPAQDVSVLYQTARYCQPRLGVHTSLTGRKHYVLLLYNEKSVYSPSSDDGLGQVKISYRSIPKDISFVLGTSKGTIAHEVFHAIIRGYQFNMGPSMDGKEPFDGFNEGLATVMGHTVDHDNAINVRPNVVDPPRSYTLMLNWPFGVFEPYRSGYNNQDFFAYVGKHYNAGSMGYLAGSDSDGEYLNGVLEQTKKYLSEHPEVQTGTSTTASFTAAYLTAMHNSFSLQFGKSLADIYWDFARNRAYENNGDSVLRPADIITPWTFQRDRFEATAIHEYTFTGNDQEVEWNCNAIPALNNIPPMSTRALLINGSDFSATLTLAVETVNWFEDKLGNSMRVKVYKIGQNGTELTPGNNTFSLDGFGTNFTQVLVLLSNLSVDGPYSIIMSGATDPIEGGGCVPYGTWAHLGSRWYVETDYLCDDDWENYYWWVFGEDGSISDFFYGLLEGYSWSMEEDTIFVEWPDGRHMEGKFSEDCDYMVDGVVVEIDGPPDTCWRARRQ